MSKHELHELPESNQIVPDASETPSIARVEVDAHQQSPRANPSDLRPLDAADRPVGRDRLQTERRDAHARALPIPSRELVAHAEREEERECDLVRPLLRVPTEDEREIREARDDHRGPEGV